MLPKYAEIFKSDFRRLLATNVIRKDHYRKFINPHHRYAISRLRKSVPYT